MKSFKIMIATCCLFISNISMSQDKPATDANINNIRTLEKRIEILESSTIKNKKDLAPTNSIAHLQLKSMVRSTRNIAIILLAGAYCHNIANNSQDLTQPNFEEAAFLTHLTKYKTTIQNTSNSLLNYGLSAYKAINQSYASLFKQENLTPTAAPATNKVHTENQLININLQDENEAEDNDRRD